MSNLYNTQGNVRELETECNTLNDAKVEKLAEFVVVNSALREKEDELKSAREEEANIQKDIDSLLGV